MKTPDLFPSLNIPKSTARTWINKDLPHVVTLNTLNMDNSQLVKETEDLKHHIKRLESKHSLAAFTFKLFGLQFQYHRLPNEECKTLLLEARHILDSRRQS